MENHRRIRLERRLHHTDYFGVKGLSEFLDTLSHGQSLPDGENHLKSKMSWIPIVVGVLAAFSFALNVKVRDPHHPPLIIIMRRA